MQRRINGELTRLYVIFWVRPTNTTRHHISGFPNQTTDFVVFAMFLYVDTWNWFSTLWYNSWESYNLGLSLGLGASISKIHGLIKIDINLSRNWLKLTHGLIKILILKNFPYHIWQGVDGCQNFVNLKMECTWKCPCILRANYVCPTSKRTIIMEILLSPWINWNNGT